MFADADALSRRLIDEDIPGLSITNVVRYLLAYVDHESALRVVRSYLVRHGEFRERFEQYRREYRENRQPLGFLSYEAADLARLSLSYGLDL